MRQLFAWLVCLLTIGLVVGLSLRFASAHNPAGAPPTPQVVHRTTEQTRSPAAEPAPTPPAAPSLVAREQGRAVYERENCATCHAIAGSGNPRLPLDGIGKRLTPLEIRAWITGTGPAAAALPAGTLRRKQRYQALSDVDLKALVDYLYASEH
jgi:mono/diheme cytochrome c family protein